MEKDANTLELINNLTLRVLALEEEVRELKSREDTGGAFVSSATPSYVSKYLQDKKAKRASQIAVAERGD